MEMQGKKQRKKQRKKEKYKEKWILTEGSEKRASKKRDIAVPVIGRYRVMEYPSTQKNTTHAHT